MKRVERFQRGVENLCYDNRILILSFLPYDDQFGEMDSLIFDYDVESNSMKLSKYRKQTEDGQIDMNKSLAHNLCLRHFYGYFSSDKTRKIYLLEWRVQLGFFFKVSPPEHLKISFIDFMPFRSRFASCYVCNEYMSMKDYLQRVEFDFSKFSNVPYLQVVTFQTMKNVIHELTRRNLRFTMIMIYCMETDREIINVEDFNLLLQRSKHVFIGGFTHFDYSSSGNGEDSPSFRGVSIYGGQEPRCRRLIIRLPESPFNFNDRFFYNFSNLSSLSILEVTFEDEYSKIQFIKKIGKFTPNLLRLDLYRIIVKNKETQSLKEDDTSLLRLLCEGNPNLREVCLEYGSCIRYEYTNLPQQLGFIHPNIRTLYIQAYYGLDELGVYKNEHFQHILNSCFPNIHRMSISDLGNSPQVVSEIPQIVQSIPKCMERLSLHLPNFRCSKALLESVISKKDQLRSLAVDFVNCGELVDTLFTFSNLHWLYINDVKHFPRLSSLTVPEYTLRKEHLKLFSKNMGNIRRIHFCFNHCEPFIYFLKYSRYTRNVRIASIGKKATNYPENPFFAQDNNNNINNDGRKTYLSDYLFFNEFERGVEYFEKFVDPEQVVKTFTRRKKEEEEFCKLGSQQRRNCRNSIGTIKDEIGKFFFDFVKNRISEEEIDAKKKEVIISTFNVSCKSWEEEGGVASPGRKEKYEVSASFSTSVEEEEEDQDFLSPFEFELKFTKSIEELDIQHQLPQSIEDLFIFCNATNKYVFARGTDESGLHHYDFLSPSGLDYLRFLFSSGPNHNDPSTWISRKNTIRLICSLVGVDTTKMTKTFTQSRKRQSANNVITLDMSWIFRESERIYGVKFEELEGRRDVEFVDCMFAK